MQIRHLIIKIITGLLVFNLASHYCCTAQIYKFTGFVFDEGLMLPLQYASISIAGSEIGTYSDEHGMFQLKAKSVQTLIVSHVGYRSREFEAQVLPDTIFLKRQDIILQDIVVSSTQLKRLRRKVVIGVRDRHHHYYFRGFRSYAVLIRSPGIETGLVKSATFRVGAGISLGRKKSLTARLRIRVYAVDPISHLPSDDLLRENITVDHKSPRKYLTIDLERYSIDFPKNGLFIGIDVLGYVGENNEIVPYSFKESYKHVAIPLNATNESVTYYRTFDKPWKAATSMDKNGMAVKHNASFSIVVNY